MTEKRPALVLQFHPPRPAAEGAPLEERDDDALMALAAADHRGAFELLAARHLGMLACFCAKFLGSRHAGEELAQDVLVEAWTRRRSYRAEGRLRVFLLRMAQSRCLNRLRDDRRRLARLTSAADGVDGEADATIAQGGHLDDLLERERERQVRAALLELPPGLREALLLRYDSELDYGEIARIVGRPEATVRSRVFHALKRLRGALAAEEEP
jgi:RNA polymerase sigma-70 factor (ECF subfamily)